MGIFISAGILALIMHIVAKHEADYSFVRVVLVAFGLFVANTVAGAILGNFAILVMFFATAWALQQFCYLRWGMAFVVTAIYYAVQFALVFAFALMFAG